MPDLQSTIQTTLLDKYLSDPCLPLAEDDVVTTHEFNFTFIHPESPPIAAIEVFQPRRR